MNSRQLEYVVVVSETLSFSEAAKQLYVSQPSLSQYIKKVENELGIEIFVRTTPLKLTYEGEIFVRFAKTVLDEEKHLAIAMADISNNKIGKISIGAGPLNSAIILPQILDRFVKNNPNIEINISEGIESDLFGLLDNGEVDILLTVMNPSQADAYYVEEVSREQYILAIPNELDPNAKLYKRSKNKQLPFINIKKCRDIPYIQQSQNMPAHVIFEELCKREGFMPNSMITCKNVNTAIQLARNGLGACFIPSSIIDELPSFFNCYRIEENDSERVIKIIYRRSMNLLPIQKEIIEYIKEYFKV